MNNRSLHRIWREPKAVRKLHIAALWQVLDGRVHQTERHHHLLAEGVRLLLLVLAMLLLLMMLMVLRMVWRKHAVSRNAAHFSTIPATDVGA